VQTIGHASAVELADVLEERRHHVLERAQPLLHVVERLDVLPRRAAAEEPVLDLLELRLDGVEHREIAVDHRVHEDVQHEPGAVPEEIGLALGARAHLQGSRARCGCAPTARSCARRRC
jgi:hypothetical protein